MKQDVGTVERARRGALTDQIVDVNAGTRRGMRVTNAPNEWCVEEVAAASPTIGPRAVSPFGAVELSPTSV